MIKYANLIIFNALASYNKEPNSVYQCLVISVTPSCILEKPKLSTTKLHPMKTKVKSLQYVFPLVYKSPALYAL